MPHSDDPSDARVWDQYQRLCNNQENTPDRDNTEKRFVLREYVDRYWSNQSQSDA